MTSYWVSTPNCTGFVRIDINGIIKETMPMWNIFVDQPITNLFRWLKSMYGEYQLEEIKDDKS